LAYRPEAVCLSDFDVLLYTDGGSGGKLDFGGSSAVILSSRYRIAHCTMSCTSMSGAYRAEFQALLDGLHAVVSLAGLEETEKSMARHAHEPISVFWLSDNEALVMNVRGEGSRRTEKALWECFNWYERYFKISAYFQGRNTGALQVLADTLASSSRVMMKERYMMLHDAGILINPKAK
jgi:hypothetical protein